MTASRCAVKVPVVNLFEVRQAAKNRADVKDEVGIVKLHGPCTSESVVDVEEQTDRDSNFARFNK